jgi:hypothetical protein
MKITELAWSQIILGVLAIIGFLIATITINRPTVEGIFTLTNSLGLFFGLFAIITGYYNLKFQSRTN